MKLPRLVGLDLRGDSGLWITIGALGNAALTVVAFRVIGELIGPDSFGEAVLLFGGALLAANLVAGPIGQALGRFYFDSTDRDERARLFSTGVALAGAACMLGLVALTALAALHVLDWNVAGLLACSFSFELMRPLTTAWLQSQSRFRAVAISQLVDAGTRPIAAIAAAQLALKPTEVGLAAYAVGGAMSVGLLTTLVVCESPWRSPSTRDARRIANYGYPLVANSLFGWLGTTGDRYFIAAALGTGAAGVYVAASALGGRVALMLGNIVETFYRPKLYQAVASGDRSTLDQIGTTWQTRVVIYGAAMFAALLIGMPAVTFLLLGPEFRNGAATVILLSFVAYWIVALGFYPIRINYAYERTIRVAATEVFGTLAMAIAVPTFGTLFGLPGAGVGLVVTAGLRFAVAVYFSRITLATASIPPRVVDGAKDDRE
jgi:O-antigen/teichoic acid export membrane protein